MSDKVAPAPASADPRIRSAKNADSGRVVRHFLSRVGFVFFLVVVSLFFALPMLWLVTAPFDANPTMAVSIPEWTLANFQQVFDNPYAMRAILNSLIIGLGTMAMVVVLGSTASYALSRVNLPGRDALLYALLLLSSIVTGTAAMVPTFQLINLLGLINTQISVVLVITSGLLPTVIFILKDFMDSMPKSYEESARLYGAKPWQILTHVVAPVARPGIAFISIWAIVQVWANFLVPFILLRSPDLQPAAVLLYTFYTESGQVDLRLVSAFSLIYSLPVLLIYFFVNRKFGFRFHGGIKS